MKKMLFVFFIVLAMVLSSCSSLGISVSDTQTATSGVVVAQTTNTPTPTMTSVPTKMSTPTATSTPKSTPSSLTMVPTATKVDAKCPYKGTGSPQPEKVAEKITGLDGKAYWAVDLSKLPACAIIFEGRFPWQTKYLPISTALSQAQVKNTDGSPWNPWDVHMIVDIKSALGAFNPQPMNELVKNIVPDEYLDWFVYSEGSIWYYDPTWNMSDVTTAKPSIGQELEAKKVRDAMQSEKYLFPRIIMQPTGTMFVYYQKDAGDTAYNNGNVRCTKTDQPEQIPVYGLWDGSQFSAAIGAGKCFMAIWIDGDKTPTVWNGYQKDAEEKVFYKSSVEAWIFPSDWKEAQVNAWVSKH